MIIEKVSGLLAKQAPAHQIADIVIGIISANASRETNRSSCAACNRPFSSFKDFPMLHLVSFKKNPVLENIVVTFIGNDNLSDRVAKVARLPSVKAYLSSIDGKCHGVARPAELYPGWMEDGWFKGAFVVPETFPGKEIAYIHLKDTKKESTLKELGIDDRAIDITLAFNGPNMGSAGGPTIMNVHVLGTLTCTGMVNVSNTAREDEVELRKQIDELLAEDDDLIACPGCGNTKTFRLATWNCYFDIENGKVKSIHGGYYGKDIADMDDVILICPSCGKVVLDTTW